MAAASTSLQASHAGQSATGEPNECCELVNVISSVTALGLSAIAAALATVHKGDLESCLAGLGGGAGPLQDIMVTLTVNYGVIITLNVVSTAVIWLSFFHCDALESSFKHTATSAKSLAILMGLAAATFLMQLVRIGYVLSMQGMLAVLAYICNMGPGVVYLGQELIYAMGNATTTAGAPGAYNSYGNNQPYGPHSASSPYLSMDAIIHNLDLLTYCKDTDGGRDAGANMVMWGCFLTMLSQALMVMALNGEKSRVSVHDLHEQHNLFEMSKQLGHQATGAFEHMPLLARHMGQEAQQAFHNPRDFASHMFWGGHGSGASAAPAPSSLSSHAAAAGAAPPGTSPATHAAAAAAAASAPAPAPAATSAALSHPAGQAAAAATAASLGVSTSHPAAQAAAVQAHAAATKVEAGLANPAAAASALAADASNHPAVQAAAAAMGNPAAAASALSSGAAAASQSALKAAGPAASGALAHISHAARKLG